MASNVNNAATSLISNHVEVVQLEVTSNSPSQTSDVKSDYSEIKPPLVTCKLCLDEVDAKNMCKLETCGCLFCEMCLMQYVEVMVIEGNVLSISCPDGQCLDDRQLTDHQISRLCSRNVFRRYQKLKFEREVHLDPCRAFCPMPGCEQVCEVHNNGEDVPVSVTCDKCGVEFCSICKQAWHPNLTCITIDLELMGVSPENSDIKRCPKCHVLIERDKGCAQMLCKRCHHLFCWYCLQSLETDFMLRHYDSGPCKDKLGHNRANIIWHRIQVVGVFAGFSLLFLVACPFLVLALPCIICCKKKCECEESPEETTEKK